MNIGSVHLESPLVVSPMAGMTDTAFRRLVKRQGGCGLVVSEMVSSEGLIRGLDRTLEYAEYTEEERPVSIQIFGGDPDRMAEAARVVESMGADIVDINMGCPVHKVARHNAGCSLMREPAHAARIVEAMVKAVRIPVTVKMRKGWDDAEATAPELARRVFGSGDCVEPDQIVARLQGDVSGVFVGRGVLRNPWILAQARDLLAGQPVQPVSHDTRAAFLHDYIDLLLDEPEAEASGFRHLAPGQTASDAVARGRERWVINKVRALCTWYTKGFDGGSRLRTSVNSAGSVLEIRDCIDRFFLAPRDGADAGLSASASECAAAGTTR
jgi:tRNA-dihydrouridine synthase B